MAALGIGAAIVGAVVYYAAIAITDFEIGIVAILIGYMVGYAVRKGAGGRGGRRLQILAVVLTYWAVGLAYTPLTLKAMSDGDTKKPAGVAADSARDSVAAMARATATAQSSDTSKDTTAGDKEEKAQLDMDVFVTGLQGVSTDKR